MSEIKKPKEKPVLMTIGNVRIVQNDDMNVMVERLEESRNNVTKEVGQKWRFKGYSRTITDALRLIVRNEWLIDKAAVIDLETILKQVELSNATILEVIET